MASERPTIVFLIDSLERGGAERIMSCLINSLPQHRYNIVFCTVLSDSRSYPIDDSVTSICLQEFATSLPWWGRAMTLLFAGARNLLCWPGISSYFKMTAELADHLQKMCRAVIGLNRVVAYFNPSLVVGFLFQTNLVINLARKLYGHKMPFIVSDHCTPSREIGNFFQLTHKVLPHYLYRQAINYVAVSRGVKDDLISNYGMRDDRVHVIHNGIDIEKIQALSAESLPVEMECLFDEDAPLTIVAVGRLAPPKGFDVLLCAMKEIISRVPCRLFIIGEGELREELEQIADANNVCHAVHFLGWQANPFAIMARCDLFVLSSKWEAFPNVILEAMAVGLPVVASNCVSGPAEALENGEFGVLVPANDPSLLAEAVVKLLSDSAKREYLVCKGHERVKLFSLQTMVAAFEELFETCLKGDANVK